MAARGRSLDASRIPTELLYSVPTRVEAKLTRGNGLCFAGRETVAVSADPDKDRVVVARKDPESGQMACVLCHRILNHAYQRHVATYRVGAAAPGR